MLHGGICGSFGFCKFNRKKIRKYVYTMKNENIQSIV